MDPVHCTPPHSLPPKYYRHLIMLQTSNMEGQMDGQTRCRLYAPPFWKHKKAKCRKTFMIYQSEQTIL